MAISRDQFTPNYEIIINQKTKIPDEMKRFISSVAYEDDADFFDKIEINIDTLNLTKNGAVQDIIDSKLFSPGNLIEVQMGYGFSLKTIGAGFIIKPKFNFGINGPSMKILAYDPFFLMSQNKLSGSSTGIIESGTRKNRRTGKNFKETTDSDIARLLGSDNGFETSQILKQKGIHNRFQKIGQNDYEFLKRIADVRGLDLYNRYDPTIKKFILYFEKPTDKQKEIFTFTYFEGEKFPESTLMEFSPEISTIDQATSFEIISFDRKKKKKISTFFQSDDLTSEPDIKLEGSEITDTLPKDKSNKVIRFKAFGNNIEIISNKPFQNEQDAKRFIEQWIKKRGDHFILGRGKLIGLEFLQSRQKHILKGLGNMLSGKYYFTSVKHMIGNSSQYQCEFTCRKVFEE